jgi:hypothetical protein
MMKTNLTTATQRTTPYTTYIPTIKLCLLVKKRRRALMYITTWQTHQHTYTNYNYLGSPLAQSTHESLKFLCNAILWILQEIS